jgi:hypothetical protein
MRSDVRGRSGKCFMTAKFVITMSEATKQSQSAQKTEDCFALTTQACYCAAFCAPAATAFGRTSR